MANISDSDSVGRGAIHGPGRLLGTPAHESTAPGHTMEETNRILKNLKKQGKKPTTANKTYRRGYDGLGLPTTFDRSTSF